MFPVSLELHFEFERKSYGGTIIEFEFVSLAILIVKWCGLTVLISGSVSYCSNVRIGKPSLGVFKIQLDIIIA